MIRNVMNVLMVAKNMIKTNRDNIGEQCKRNDDGVLAISDEDRNSRLQTFCKIGFLKNFANYRKRLAPESKMTKQLGKVIMKSF